MKFSALKFSVAGLSLLALSSVHAQSTQSGIVRFTGNISPVTCIVNLGSRDQKIDFGVVPPNANGFTSGGGAVGNVALPSHQRTITIRLDGCSTPGANNQPTTATVRFDGPIRNGRINTSNATADIQLLENNSTTAIWDLSGPSAPVNLQSGTNTLNYIARYYVAAVPLASGEANAEATFTMNYQ